MADLGGRPARSAHFPRSLLERLRDDDLQRSGPSLGPLAARITSIKTNLVRILNGRAGGAGSAPAFGLGDFNDAAMGSADLMTMIAADIRSAIISYEPRISDVRVQFDRSQNGGHVLFFTISAHTAIGAAQDSLVLDLVMREGRHFEAA